MPKSSRAAVLPPALCAWLSPGLPGDCSGDLWETQLVSWMPAGASRGLPGGQIESLLIHFLLAEGQGARAPSTIILLRLTSILSGAGYGLLGSRGFILFCCGVTSAVGGLVYC